MSDGNEVTPQFLQEMCKSIDHSLNGEAASTPFKRYGMALFVFEFGIQGEQKMQYISTSERAFMVQALKAFLAQSDIEDMTPKGSA